MTTPGTFRRFTSTRETTRSSLNPPSIRGSPLKPRPRDCPFSLISYSKRSIWRSSGFTFRIRSPTSTRAPVRETPFRWIPETVTAGGLTVAQAVQRRDVATSSERYGRMGILLESKDLSGGRGLAPVLGPVQGFPGLQPARRVGGIEGGERREGNDGEGGA